MLVTVPVIAFLAPSFILTPLSRNAQYKLSTCRFTNLLSRSETFSIGACISICRVRRRTMARRTALTSISLLVAGIIAVQTTYANPFAGFKELNEQKEAALQCEAQGKWRQIHWRSTVDQAAADAQRLRKPILVVLVVGKKGQKN